MAENLGKRPKNSEAHHYLPVIPNELDEPLELTMLKLGLDPNSPEFGDWIPIALHKKIHTGEGWGLGGPWNYNWKRFFEENPNPTRQEVLDFLSDLKKVIQNQELSADEMLWPFPKGQ